VSVRRLAGRTIGQAASDGFGVASELGSVYTTQLSLILVSIDTD